MYVYYEMRVIQEAKVFSVGDMRDELGRLTQGLGSQAQRAPSLTPRT